MGEYIKYRNREIKVGTVENLYYVSFDKFRKAFDANELAQLPGNYTPTQYMETQYGFRFRFPFPDEDKLPLGDIRGEYNRSIPVRIDQSAIPDIGLSSDHYVMRIMQQKPIIRRSDGKECLALIWISPHDDLFRIEDDAEVKKIAGEMFKHHVAKNPDKEQKEFYRQIATRILEGYNFTPQQIQKIIPTAKPMLKPRKTGKKL